eukprot:PhM_4_TR9797/c4_g1_i4/m.63030
MPGPYPPLPAPGTVGVDGYAMNPAFGQQPQQQFYPPPTYPPQPGGAGAYPSMPPPLDAYNNTSNVCSHTAEDALMEKMLVESKFHFQQNDNRCKYENLAMLVLGILNFSLWMAFYALHIELGCECGRSDRWLLSLVPILLGPFLLGIPLYGILHAYTAFFKGRGMRSNQNRFTFGA